MTKEEIIELINSRTDWYNKSYAGYFFGIHQQGFLLSHSSSKSPYGLDYGICWQNHGRKDHMDWFWDVSLQNSKRDMLLNKVESEDAFIKEFVDKWQDAYDKYVEYFNLVAKMEIGQSSLELLHDAFSKLIEKAIDQGSLGYIIDVLLTHGDDWFSSRLKNEFGDRLNDETLGTLSAPARPTFANDYELSLLQIKKKLMQGATSDAEQLAEILSGKFFWLRTNYLDFVELTAADVLEESKALNFPDLITVEKEILNKKNIYIQNKDAKALFLYKLKASDGLKRLIKFAEIATYIQDRRKECALRHNHLMFRLLNWLRSKAPEIGPDYYYYLTEKEILTLLDDQPVSWDEVRRRRDEGVLALYHDGGYELLYKDEIQRSINNKNIFPELATVEEVRGTPAFKGVVRGYVRILRNSAEIKLFPEGAVLVANQTTPEFIAAMRRAIAVVTDQGGITSHAAIVSRELQVPCIVGTKIATKILKDGDEVEINAEKGIVTVIKHA